MSEFIYQQYYESLQRSVAVNKVDQNYVFTAAQQELVSTGTVQPNGFQQMMYASSAPATAYQQYQAPAGLNLYNQFQGVPRVPVPTTVYGAQPQQVQNVPMPPAYLQPPNNNESPMILVAHFQSVPRNVPVIQQVQNVPSPSSHLQSLINNESPSVSKFEGVPRTVSNTQQVRNVPPALMQSPFATQQQQQQQQQQPQQSQVQVVTSALKSSKEEESSNAAVGNNELEENSPEVDTDNYKFDYTEEEWEEYQKTYPYKTLYKDYEKLLKKHYKANVRIKNLLKEIQDYKKIIRKIK